MHSYCMSKRKTITLTIKRNTRERERERKRKEKNEISRFFGHLIENRSFVV